MKPTFMGIAGKRGVSARTSRNSVELGWTRSWGPRGEAQLSPSAASGEEVGCRGRVWDPQEGCRHQPPEQILLGSGLADLPSCRDLVAMGRVTLSLQEGVTVWV